MLKDKGPASGEPNVFLTAACNRRCVYCSAEGEDRAMSPRQVREVLEHRHPTLVFEGGEPLLSRRLEGWVREARAKGAADISVLTNGLALTDRRRRSLLRAGADHFHFNFPSHIEELYDSLTGTSGLFRRQTEAVRAAAAAGPEQAVLVCVMNSKNLAFLPDYVDFAAREFPGLFYIAFNFIKIKGAVKRRPWLVPDLKALGPSLREALGRARSLGLDCLVDGVPLCFLKGFEAHSRDVSFLMKGDRVYLSEKKPVAACARCGLAAVCAGPRADYLALRGASGFRAAPKGAAGPVKRRASLGQVSLNSRRRRTTKGGRK